MSPLTKNKKVDSNAGIKSTNFDFSTLNYPEEIRIHTRRVMNLNEKVIFPQTFRITTHPALTASLSNLAVL